MTSDSSDLAQVTTSHHIEHTACRLDETRNFGSLFSYPTPILHPLTPLLQKQMGGKSLRKKFGSEVLKGSTGAGLSASLVVCFSC